MLTAAALGAALVACGGGGGDTGLTKSEVAAGKGDPAVDYCAVNGWYGDGACDDFCRSPDPDCMSQCQANHVSCPPASCSPDEVVRCDAASGCLTCAPPPEAAPSCGDLGGQCVAAGPDGAACPDGTLLTDAPCLGNPDGAPTRCCAPPSGGTCLEQDPACPPANCGSSCLKVCEPRSGCLQCSCGEGPTECDAQGGLCQVYLQDTGCPEGTVADTRYACGDDPFAAYCCMRWPR